MTPLVTELIRQLLRLVGVYLMTIGLPPEAAALLEHPEVIGFVVGMVSYATADTAWLASLWMRWRKWRAAQWEALGDWGSK